MRRALLCALILLVAAPAFAQTKIVPADEFRLNTVPCTLTSRAATGAPTGGNDCDMVTQTDGLWVKSGGTWVLLGTVTEAAVNAAFGSKTAHYVYAAPSGSAGTPSFRALVASDVPGSGLSKTDDTNVTLTLGGSYTTALLNAASLTLGWTGQLGLTRGGTNASLTASNGGIVYSGGSALAILSGTATAGQMLRSGASAAPSWSTPTWPNTAASGKLLRGDGSNWVESTPQYPNTATAGKVLRANGTNWVESTAVYPDTASTTGAFPRANGTDWVMSTLTLPNAATLGRVVYATGTNAWGESSAMTFDGSALTVGGLVSGHVYPSAASTYDLGSVTAQWRNGYIDTLGSVIFRLDTNTIFNGYSTVGYNAGTLAAAVASGDTQVNFGITMTPTHWVVIRSADTGGAVTVEYMLVGTLVSGTTYNVTRNLSGAGLKNWAAGTPFLVLGASGTGRIELLAGETGVTGIPRLSMLTQGATYGASTEQVRIGNLNGSYGYGTNTYGFAAGDWTKGAITADATSLKIWANGAAKVTIDATDATFSGTVGASGFYTATSGARTTMTSSGIKGYDASAQRYQLSNDGSGWLGASTTFAWNTAGTVTMSGWTVTADALAKDTGTDATSAGMAPAVLPFYAGATAANRLSAPFRVTPAGALYASNATLTGSLTAGSGNLVLDSTGIAQTMGATYNAWANAAAYRFYPGNGNGNIGMGAGETNAAGTWYRQLSLMNYSTTTNERVHLFLQAYNATGSPAGTMATIQLLSNPSVTNTSEIDIQAYETVIGTSAGSPLLHVSDTYGIIAYKAISGTSASFSGSVTAGNAAGVSYLNVPYANGPSMFIGDYYNGFVVGETSDVKLHIWKYEGANGGQRGNLWHVDGGGLTWQASDMNTAGSAIAAGHFYEAGRSYYAGQVQAFNPGSFTTDGGGSASNDGTTCHFSVVGGTVHLECQTTFTTSGSNTITAVHVGLPTGFGSGAYENTSTTFRVWSGGPQGYGIATVGTSSGDVALARGDGSYFGNGTQYICWFQITYFI